MPGSLTVGDVLGPYRIDVVLGVGGMGIVYGGTDLRLDRRVAIKVMLGHATTSPEYRTRFQREAATLASLDSPHVIAIYDHGEADGAPYLVTQYADGGDLRRALRIHGPMPLRLAAQVCAQVASALAAAHAVGVVHRDVKPGNVLLRDDRTDRPHTYLCDFGIARTDDQPLTAPGDVRGTWDYLAPECTMGAPASPASDIYAVGCLLWELTDGAPPYTGSPTEVALAHRSASVPRLGHVSQVGAVASGVSGRSGKAGTRRHAGSHVERPQRSQIESETPRSRRGLGRHALAGTGIEYDAGNRLLARALAKDPRERHGTASELAEELRQLATVAAPPRRRRWPVLVATATAVGALVAGGVAGFVTRDDAAPADGPAAGAAATVAGDLDADGYGDVALAGLSGTPAMVYASDGEDLQESGQPEVGTAGGVADVDGDGTAEPIRVRGLMTFTVLEGDEPVSVPISIDVTYPRIAWAVLGDWDGDGRTDVGAVTSDMSGDLAVDVALSGDDGEWSRSEHWFRDGGWYRAIGQREDATDTSDLGSFAIGDLDGDGDDDLAFVDLLHGGVLRILSAEDGEFAELKVAEAAVVSGNPTLYAGDFDGDGSDELAIPEEREPPRSRAAVWSLNGDELTREVWSHDGPIGGGLATAVSDVDGDGHDDLVHLVDGELTVARAADGAFETSGKAVPVESGYRRFLSDVVISEGS